MSGLAFIDTNVVIYLLSGEEKRADRSEELLQAGGVVSLQVLNETASVARGKHRLSWPEVEELLAMVRASCKVVPLTLETHTSAVAIAQRHQLAFYDALICASAVAAGATVLWTEDMNHGQLIDGVSVANPYIRLKPDQPGSAGDRP